jgi:hypothetical protein
MHGVLVNESVVPLIFHIGASATGAVTVTVQVAVKPPSAVVTVTVELPADSGVTIPADDTVATAVLDEVQLTFVFVALDGATVAVTVPVVPPADRFKLIGLRLTPVTAMGALTVTAHVAVLPPSAVVTVIVAKPTATGVTTPLAETVAIVVSLLVQATFVFVAFAGVIVGVNVPAVQPAVKLKVFGLRLTLVTATGALTVTAHVAVFPPSAVVTVIVVVPTATGVTTPVLLTVATPGLELVHATAVPVAVAGASVAVRVPVAPPVIGRYKVVLLRLMLVTAT